MTKMEIKTNLKKSALDKIINENVRDFDSLVIFRSKLTINSRKRKVTKKLEDSHDTVPLKIHFSW